MPQARRTLPVRDPQAEPEEEFRMRAFTDTRRSRSGVLQYLVHWDGDHPKGIGPDKSHCWVPAHTLREDLDPESFAQYVVELASARLMPRRARGLAQRGGAVARLLLRRRRSRLPRGAHPASDLLKSHGSHSLHMFLPTFSAPTFSLHCFDRTSLGQLTAYCSSGTRACLFLEGGCVVGAATGGGWPAAAALRGVHVAPSSLCVGASCLPPGLIAGSQACL